MNCLERDSGGNWAKRIAVRLVDAAFAACVHLPRTDRELLLREIAKRALWLLSNDTMGARIPEKEVVLEIPEPPLKVRSAIETSHGRPSNHLKQSRAA
jgi:hypothetical protein